MEMPHRPAEKEKKFWFFYGILLERFVCLFYFNMNINNGVTLFKFYMNFASCYWRPRIRVTVLLPISRNTNMDALKQQSFEEH
jgi:hypothetical protein